MICRLEKIFWLSFAIIVIIVSLVNEPVYSGGAYREIRVNDTTFLMAGRGESVDSSQLFWFENLFSEISRKVYENLNLKSPINRRLYLTSSAKEFGNLTGKNWYIAALYENENDIFYFQNIASLKKNGFLEKIVFHEICHQAISLARLDILPGNFQNNDYRFYDESFCSGMYPSGNEFSSPGFTAIPFEFREYMNRLTTQKGTPEKTSEIYSEYYRWGNFLIQSLGQNIALRVVLEGNEEALLKIFRLYRERRHY